MAKSDSSGSVPGKVPQEVEDILVEYTIKVLVEKPDDLLAHAAQYFSRLRDARNAQTSASGNMESVSTTLANRRRSVRGVQYDPSSDAWNEEDEEKDPKSKEEQTRILERIKNVFLLRVLTEKEKMEITTFMIPRSVKANEVILQKDDPGSNFYVVDSGTFHTSDRVYSENDYFGELSLLYSEPNSENVTAQTDGRLWSISGKVFQRFLRKRACQKRDLYKAFVDQVPALQPLSEYEKMQVCDAIVPVQVEKGDTLFNEGDDGNGLYFVQEGAIAMRNSEDGEAPRHEKGDYFGEMSLVKHKPRERTAVALEDTKLAFLDLDAFERLLGPCRDILSERIDGNK